MAIKYTLTLFFILTASIFSFSSSPSIFNSTSISVNRSTEKAIPVLEIIRMKIREAEKMAGRKFSFKEKIAFKLLQIKLKKEIKKSSVSKKTKSSKGAKVALVLSILSLATVYFPFVSIPLAVLGIVIGQRAYKRSNYEDKKARTAVNLSILALGIIVIAIMIIGIFVSDGSFGIFVLS